MGTLDFITLRRSIRKYSNKKVSAELVQKILEAGMSAPSAENQQPWQFIVINKKNLLTKIAYINTPYASFAKEASVGILVCGDLKLEKHKGYWIMDCCASTENILLAANSLGLGAVWTSIYPAEYRVERYRKLLNLPAHIIPLAFIPIGYPAEEPEKKDNYKKDRIHYNSW